MSHSPYSPPAASLAFAPSKPVPLYSPTQAAMGALLGGPVGLVYFLRSNFVALGNLSAARKCLWAGALIVVALVVILPLLPEKFPSSPFNLAYIFAARGVTERFQLNKAAIASSPEYAFQSNWRVFGLGLLCLVGSVVAIGGPIMALTLAGVVA